MKKLTYLYCLFTLAFMVSCGGEPQEGNKISEEDFFGETGEETVQEEDVLIDTTVYIPEGPINKFVYGQLTEFDTVEHTAFHSLDRFTFSDRQKIEFKSKEEIPYGKDVMVNPRAELFYYSFSDTTKTKNAFYNWLDCFSDECEQVKLNEDFEALKMPPQFTLVYDTVIVVVDYRCEDKGYSWRPFQDSIISQFGKDYNYCMQVRCGGPLSWK